jgi:hypothetical protein
VIVGGLLKGFCTLAKVATLMTNFKPGFNDFQKDIERYLASTGRREKCDDGMIVFHGYDDALNKMFGWYLTKGALAPLAKHFRSWNWEYQYNDFLTGLTSALEEKRDWDNLHLLWEKGVLRCRKKMYNDIWKLEKDDPGTIKPTSYAEAKARLLKTLVDILLLAESFGSAGDIDRYRKMVQKVENGRKA